MKMMFFCVFLIIDYDYVCSETDFTQEKSNFHPTSRIPSSSLLFAAALSQNVPEITMKMSRDIIDQDMTSIKRLF